MNAHIGIDPRESGQRTALVTGGKFFGPKCRERAVPARAAHPQRRGLLWAASEALVQPYLAGAEPRRDQAILSELG